MARSPTSTRNFQKGVRSTVFLNAPAGFLYPGDSGFPEGTSGLNKRWLNFSPRAGVAWDVPGNGRSAVRSSYGVADDFPPRDDLYIKPRPRRSLRLRGEILPRAPRGPVSSIVPGGHADPCHVPACTTAFPAFGAFGTIDPEIDSPRVQHWKVTLERQFGARLGLRQSVILVATRTGCGEPCPSTPASSGASARARSPASPNPAARRPRTFTSATGAVPREPA